MLKLFEEAEFYSINKLIIESRNCLIGSLAGAARVLNDNTREQCLSPTDQKSVFAFKDNR